MPGDDPSVPAPVRGERGELFDAHLHIIDPRFPLIANNGYLPEPFDAGHYLAAAGPLGVTGGAVVSGSFQGFDQQYLITALHELRAATGSPDFVGVTNLPADVEEQTIRDLDDAGVRAVRFNLYRGGSAGLADLDVLARRAHEVAGWHSELYVDATDLPDLADTLLRLPQVSLDHLGMRADDTGTLLRLVEAGSVVKATGFGRIDLPDPDALMRQILQVNPHGLIFGTDLPSTRAARPFEPADLRRVVSAVGPDHAAAVLAGNARRLYRLDHRPDAERSA